MSTDGLKQKTTHKKVKVVGKDVILNTSTGELETVSHTIVQDRDFDFTKVWMKNLLLAFDAISNQKMKVAMWVIENLDKENKIIGTYDAIAHKSGVSRCTVIETMKLLQDANFLQKVQNGVYMVNPDVMFKGSKGARMGILTTYDSSGKSQLVSDRKRLENMRKSMQQLEGMIKEAEKQMEISKEMDEVKELMDSKGLSVKAAAKEVAKEAVLGKSDAQE